MRWLACELHTHTIHSDGKQTLDDLAAGARRLGFDAIALTDHNTMSGLADKARVERETGLTIVPGMEWTTFYGHMVTIGAAEPADWRRAEPGTILEGVAEVHRLGGLAGLAHPFRIGSPACTGCYWEFDVTDWSRIDYIEVWSTTFAPIKADNLRAFQLWTRLLNAGIRIAATSGRDWHEQKETDDPLSVTYLGIDDEAGGEARGTDADGNGGMVTPVSENVRVLPSAAGVPGPSALATSSEAAVAALRAGRVSVTIGPLLTLEACASDGRAYGIGDVVPPGSGACELRVRAAFAVRPGLWELEPQTFRLLANGGEDEPLAEWRVESGGGTYVAELPAGAKRPAWIRAELWGVVRGVYALVAFTNAVYFDRERSDE